MTIALSIFIVICLYLIYFWLKSVRHQTQSITYLISLPSPGNISEDPKKLYLLLHALLFSYAKTHRFRQAPKLSLEIISTTKKGIEFYVIVPIELSSLVKRYLISYWPRLEIQEIQSEKLIVDSRKVKVSTWKPNQEIVNTLAIEHIFSGMHDLANQESARLQVVISPYRFSFIKTSLRVLIKFPLGLLKMSTIVLLDVILNYRRIHDHKTKLRIQSKTNNYFFVTIRSVVIADNVKRLHKLDIALNVSATSYGLIHSKKGILSDYSSLKHKHPILMSSEDVSQTFYFPSLSKDDSIEDLAKTASYKLPSPVSMKIRSNPDVVIGINDYSTQQHVIGLTVSERQKHLLIIGGTGMGKTTLIEYAIVQDIINGKGVALIDPHGDLASKILNYIPQERIKDVIYIDPKDISFPVSINLMELPKGLQDDELELTKDFITESIISIFRKIFSDDDSGGHRIEYILRNTIHTAFYVQGATLFTIHKLLTNDIFRASVVARVNDDGLKDFWYGEFNKAGSYQRVKMIAGVTAKLGRFQRSIVSKRMLESPNSSIDFDELLARGKILICNFSKGTIGEDTSSLLGMIVLTKIQLAAWKRALVPIGDRRPCYLYVDEFQNFSSHLLSQIVSESRKYGICLTIAEQTMANQDEKEANILLANIGNVICFRTAAQVDSQRMISLFSPLLKEQDITNLEPYRFYIRLSNEFTLEPISGKTMLLKDSKTEQKIKIVDSSRILYATKYVPKQDNTNVPNAMRVPLK